MSISVNWEYENVSNNDTAVYIIAFTVKYGFEITTDLQEPIKL
jgi:hypothetical protein